jgi:hypothetical protein
VSAPKPASELKAGALTYKAQIEFSGQKIALDMKSEVKEENGAWVVTETAKGAMGELSDITVLAKGSLQLVKRSIKQGPVAIDIDFKDNKANGNLSMNGQTRPIAAELGGALFADGAGASLAIATLPLADGYTTTYRNFDVQTGKVKLMQLKVTGMESVVVPAGTFEAYKVEVTSAEGDAGKTTIWVAKDGGKAVKTTAVLPQMNGATMTMELVQ